MELKKGIGNMRYFLIGIFALFFASIQAEGDFTFEVRSPTLVGVGEPFNIQFVITSDRAINASNFQAPTFRGLNIHSGPSQSTSSSTSIINGVRSQTVTLTLTYRVSAVDVGVINFGPASIDIGGRTAQTRGASIEVSRTAQAQQQQRQTPQPSEPRALTDDDVSLRGTVNRTSVYQGEEILLTYTLFRNINIRQFSIHNRAPGQGFWSENIPLTLRPVQQDGGISLDLTRELIYPQHSGRLTIAPLEVEIVALVATRPAQRSRDPFADFFNDPFGSFFGMQQTQPVTKIVRSNPVVINVRPLPEQGKPESFRGDVGRFAFNSEIDRTTLRANEALTITVTISGRGNLRHIRPPEVRWPADFEVFTPTITENIQVTENGMSGSKTFQFLAIPRTQGSYSIPPIEFSFFDPTQSRYITHKTEEFRITVERGDQRFMATAVGTATESRYLNRDIEFIKMRTSPLRDINQKFLFSTLFWILFGLPFLLLIAFLIVRKQLEIRNADIVGSRNRRAFKEARKNLRKAEKFMNENNKDAFYIEISQALWGFLSKKFNIPVAELSIENVHHVLLGKQIQTEHIDQFLKALENCEFARFAPNGSSAQSMKDVYDEALEVISGIVKHLNE
ncbi:MAG: BatD family protein [Bacteroidales bacterium]|nr:BatD family protein [Bacteroidales bacterium]